MAISKPLPDCWWVTPEIDSIGQLPELLATLDQRVEQGIRYVQFMQRTIAFRPSGCVTGHPSPSDALSLGTTDSFCRDRPV